MDKKQILEIFQIILAIYGALNAIAAATPSKKDDKIMSKIGRFFDLLSVGRKQD